VTVQEDLLAEGFQATQSTGYSAGNASLSTIASRAHAW
jgi:hypothetical protein